MIRRILLVAVVCSSLLAFGQRGSGSTSGAGASAGPAGSPGTSVPGGTPTTAGTVGGLAGAASSGAVNAPTGNAGVPTMQETVGGPAGTTGTNQGNPANLNTFPATTTSTGFGISGGGVLATPEATFASPNPMAGISDSGRAGISNLNPVDSSVIPTTPSSTMVFVTAPSINPRPVNPAALANGRLIVDLGPSEFVGAANSGSSGESLADLAAKRKSQVAAQNVRTITNADVERLLAGSSNPGPVTNASVMASNTPPANMPGQGQASSAQAQTSASQSSTAQSSPAPAAGQTGSQAAQTTTPAAGNQAAGSTAQGANSQQQNPSSASSATTPQIAPQQQPGSEQGNNRLPATSTVLPLLGLLGIASSGAGLWYRKHRK